MIRLLTPEDFALWKAIRLEAVREHPDAFGGSYEDESLRSDEQWRPDPEKTPVFAYFDAGIIVAMAGYIIPQQKKLAHRGRVFTIYTRKEYRGRGIMDTLLNAISEHARANMIEQLHLTVGMHNAAAKRCYERNGFAVYASEARALKIGDRYIDDYLMVKYL